MSSYRLKGFGLSTFTVCLIASSIGCGESGPPRIEVSGEVKWNGEKVPAGFVTFNPDVRKGNSGPRGMAKIVDGRYDTRNGGRPAVAGPMEASVGGFDGIDANDANTYGN